MIGQVSNLSLKEVGKVYVQFLILNLPGAVKTLNKQSGISDIRTSYRAISPGTYVATYASCSVGESQVWMDGDEGVSLFRPTSVPMLRPLAGANHIVIGPGQIVDAGILDIHVLQSDLRPNGHGIAVLTGSEAPPIFREAIKKNLPDLYPKITYTRFTPYPGTLLSVPKK